VATRRHPFGIRVQKRDAHPKRFASFLASMLQSFLALRRLANNQIAKAGI
jgi:hypothetical protein